MDATHLVLLRRQSVVFLDSSQVSEPENSFLLEALEVELLALGYLLNQKLRDALSRVSAEQLHILHGELPNFFRARVGADRIHVPLFRKFPESIPEDTWLLYVQRMVSLVFQRAEQPCPLCGQLKTIHVLDPCGHLVCSSCWDGANYSGCPICHRHLNPNSPFLQPISTRAALQDGLERLIYLDLGGNLTSSVKEAVQSLLGRTLPLSPQDKEDLLTLLSGVGFEALEWLPERIPVKETMAWTLGNLLKGPQAFESYAPLLKRHLHTATDVLRLVAVWMGLDPSLTPVSGQTRKMLNTWLEHDFWKSRKVELLKPYFPRLRSLPRVLRKGVLGVLEGLEQGALVEDMLRHRLLWKRVGNLLHPFEFHRRYPKTALAFVALRRTDLRALDETLKTSLKEVAPSLAALETAYYRPRTWASRLEAAFKHHQLERVLALLNVRSGELGRRLDHTLRELAAHHPEGYAVLLASLPEHLGYWPTPMALTLLTHLNTRDQKLTKRVFFPKGEVLLSYASKDTRALLSRSWLNPIIELLENELLHRLSKKPKFSSAILDQGLRHVFVPFAERSTARSLVSVPRGSFLPVPEGKRLRLFLHWMQNEEQRVDLDLSVSFYDPRWKYLDKCDFTRLRSENDAFVHSGDYTDAPAPLGASEFVDLNLKKLKERGIRYIMMVVFSYNSIPFDHMALAFAGLMNRRDDAGEVVEPRTVTHRFDLQGNAQIATPLLLDLERLRMRWLDLKVASQGVNHQVGGYFGRLAGLGSDLTAYYDSGARPTLWQLACLHAAARSKQVQVRLSRGGVRFFERALGETSLEFYRRLLALTQADAKLERIQPASQPLWAALLRDDLKIPDSSEMYALYWQNHSVQQVQQLAASDLLR